MCCAFVGLDIKQYKMHGTYIKKDGYVFVHKLQHGVKKVIRGTT